MVKDRITLNVLAEIAKKVNRTDISASTNKALIVFTGSNIQLDERIEELKEIQAGGIDFSLAFSFMGERILDIERIINSLNPIKVYREEDVFKLEYIADEYSIIIGSSITINTLSKVSLGMADSFISNAIWAFLYKGKPVYLDFTSVRNYLGGIPKNKEINDIIENYINKVKKMGVKELKPGNYKDGLSFNSFLDDKDNGRSISNKVITERDIIKYEANKSIMLSKGTIITPLAKDRAKELGIVLEIDK